ncbi:OmpA family protein [Winogradskyella arenosi]|uniref:Outer membrane protein OmpA-like peptidoglycan-associated protein n=1 Tax=Winogradskyella arenosi TaxID=533325 RepID=A0A368ZEP1_9FLAO|nr:OmpA family protein [Winogradskyella arenosi]RCW91668.1 outer membrane protein OmpA-like peptidoglycan-associated protein [Winogradskyella arenosi]
MRIFNLYITIIAIVTSSVCFSQSVRKANLLYKNKAYLEAAEIFELLPKTSANLEKLGDCYYYNSDYTQAYNAYMQVYNLNEPSTLSEKFYFKYFEVLKGTKRYKEADEISTLYLNDSINTLEFKSLLKQVAPYNYELQNITENVGGSSFGVGIYGDKIVFSSTKNIENPNYNWNGMPYLDLYEATITDGETIALDSIQPLDNKINTAKQHESNAVFTKDGTMMYFSRNLKKRVDLDSTKIAVVSIFRSELIEGEWTKPEPVSFAGDTYSIMHPTLNEKEDRLYFSSDMPGTLGDFDIFYVDLFTDHSFGQPINLGETVNTKRREQFPYIGADNTLYFASNGKQGFGGLDLFSSRMEDNKFLEALNLGETINTEKDDFSIVVIDSINTGYVSSNRSGQDNIYTFKRLYNERSYFIEGIVTDKITGKILPNTTVTLFDINGNLIAEQVVGEDGKYKLSTLPNQKYTLEGFKPKYIPQLEFFDTNDKGNIEFNIELEIESYKDAEDIVTDDDKGNTYIELENIYFDFGKWDIKPQAAKTLDILVALLKKYPRMEIQLGAHTDSRSGYEFNLELSKKRAQATLEYLVENNISRTRLRSKGYGESQPLVPCGDNCTETEYSINRRCEFLILR